MTTEHRSGSQLIWCGTLLWKLLKVKKMVVNSDEFSNILLHWGVLEIPYVTHFIYAYPGKVLQTYKRYKTNFK